MLSALLDPGAAPPALVRPQVRLSFGGGGEGGGGLVGAVADAVGLGAAGPGLEAGLVGLRVHRTMAPGVDWAEMMLAPVPGGPSLPAVGDEGSIALVAGDAEGVFACAVDLVETRPDGLRRVTASNGGRLLARLRRDLGFADRSPGEIIDALAREAGTASGAGAVGERLPRYVVDGGRSLLEHVARLAASAGRLACFDGEGALALVDDAAAGEPVADLAAGANLIDMRIVERPPAGTAIVRGDGAPDQGGTAWAWLRKDPAPAAAEAGDGDPARAVAAPWARVRGAAAALAEARRRAMLREATYGRFIVSAVPQAVPGATVTLSGSDGHDGPWLVIEAEQRFDLAGGLTGAIRAVPLGGGGAFGLGGLL